MTNAKSLNTVTQGITWEAPDYKSKIRISPKVREEIQSGEKLFDYPEPDGNLEDWARDLSPEQVVQAFYDYNDRWTWDTGSVSDKEILDILDKEIKCRGNPSTGTAFFDTVDNMVYVYDGTEWQPIAVLNPNTKL